MKLSSIGKDLAIVLKNGTILMFDGQTDRINYCYKIEVGLCQTCIIYSHILHSYIGILIYYITGELKIKILHMYMTVFGRTDG